MVGDVDLLRERLWSVVREKAEQGHDVSAVEHRLTTAPDSVDALIELADELADLPLRADWSYTEPHGLDAIWEECPPQRPTAAVGRGVVRRHPLDPRNL